MSADYVYQIILAYRCRFYKISPRSFWRVLIASKLALSSVSGLEDEKLIQKQSYMKTETGILYSRVFLILLPNVVKIDLYNSELHRFKAGAFIETQCI